MQQEELYKFIDEELTAITFIKSTKFRVDQAAA
jgi:hypothetical protein